MADPTPTDPGWPTPSGRDAVLDRVLRGGRRRLMINRLLIAGAVTAGGLAGGVALGATDTVSVLEEEVVPTGDALAGLRPCPGLDPVAQLRGGDRVFLTGRSDDGEWLQLRSPFDADDRFWIEAGLVTGDDEVSALPTATCGDVELTLTLPDGTEVTVTTTTSTVPGETTTTSTTEPGETTTTASTVPGQTTTQPQPTQPVVTTTPPPQTTTTTAPPPTTQPPDNTGPAISNFTRSVASISETPGEFCVAPFTVILGATVSDPSGISQVSIRYRVTSAANPNVVHEQSGFLNMSHQGGGVYRRTVGPFPITTITPPDGATVIRWEVRAFDSHGNQTTVSAPSNRNVTLTECS